MSLVFESDEAKAHPESAATHVLLVGCGAYPKMAAAGYPNQQPLTCSALSVTAMANWFLGGPDGCAPGPGAPSDQAFYNPSAPLGSVEILASPMAEYESPTGRKTPIDRPSRANIRDAYLRWLSRLGTNANSHGVFYFCGHGVGDGVDQFLVADDFGEDPDDKWSAAFHVSNTCQASIRKTPASLLFLIDACMEFSRDLVFELDEPKALIAGSRRGDPLCSEWLVLTATTTNRLAYALPKEAARFTKSILQALRGYCGIQRAGQANFDITVAQLRSAAAAFLALLQPPGDARWQKIGTSQGEGGWNIPFHVLTKRPVALVHIDVDPPGRRPEARAFMEKAGMARSLKPIDGGPAEFNAEWGEWSYGVSATEDDGFREQMFKDQLLQQSFFPYKFNLP